MVGSDKKKTDGWVDFVIPDRKWLTDNKWLEADRDNGAPAFLQSIKLFVPSGSSSTFKYDVHTAFDHSGHSTLAGKEYHLPHTVMETQYVENDKTGYCGNIQNNLFNINSCKKDYRKVLTVLIRNLGTSS